MTTPIASGMKPLKAEEHARKTTTRRQKPGDRRRRNKTDPCTGKRMRAHDCLKPHKWYDRAEDENPAHLTQQKTRDEHHVRKRRPHMGKKNQLRQRRSSIPGGREKAHKNEPKAEQEQQPHYPLDMELFLRLESMPTLCRSAFVPADTTITRRVAATTEVAPSVVHRKEYCFRGIKNNNILLAPQQLTREPL